MIPDDAKRNKSVAFKNDAPFINCISKINDVKIDNAEELGVVMPMYNLLEYSKNYKKQQEVCRIITEMNQAILFLLILNLLRITGSTYNIGYDGNKVGKNETEVVVPLKHLSNFWRTLNIPLIYCEIELILTWSKSCALADISVRAAGINNDPPAFVAPTGLKFQITDTKLYVPGVILPTENDKKLLEQLKLGFKRTVK